MSRELWNAPPWLCTMLLAEDDTEASVMGSDLHHAAIVELYASLLDYAEALGGDAGPSWYVSSQVTVMVSLPQRDRPWQPIPDLFVVPGVPAHARSSYDARVEGPMPPFVLEVASESTWRYDIGDKAELYRAAGVREYLVFDPATQWLAEAMRGWRRVGETWEPWLPEEHAGGQRGWHSTELGLWFRPEGLLLRAEHPKQGVLPIRRELREQLVVEYTARRTAEEWAAREHAERLAAAEEAAHERAERVVEQARAANLERQLREAQEELERLRGDIGR